MSDSTDSGWWSAAGPPPTPPEPEQIDLRLRPRRRAPRSLLVLAVLVAALVVALLGGAFAGSSPPAPGPVTHSSSLAWTSAQGRQVQSAYLTSCQSAGGGSAYCGCLFSQITAQAPYSTPATFAALGAAVKQDEQSNDLAAIPPAITQADNSCSQPGASSPSARHPI
jgi:hypothetical protein